MFVVETDGGPHYISGVFLDREKAARFASMCSKHGVSMKVTGFKLEEIPSMWLDDFQKDGT